VAVTALFSGDILQAWTGSAALASKSKDVFSVLVLGAGMNVVMHLPSVLQVSHGWLSLCLFANTVTIAIVLPLTIIAAFYWGGVGAAAVFLAYNVVQVIVLPHFIHKRILPGEKRKWYVNDLGVPLVVAFLSVFLLKFVHVAWGHRVTMLLWLGVVYAVSFSLTAFSTAEGREYMRQFAHWFFDRQSAVSA
jgi:hypothetical protein